MNKNKVIALLIVLAVFFGPFGMLFAYNGNVVVLSATEIFLFLAWLGGMIVAFYIGVNEPFTKKETAKADFGSGAVSARKAA